MKKMKITKTMVFVLCVVSYVGMFLVCGMAHIYCTFVWNNYVCMGTTT